MRTYSHALLTWVTARCLRPSEPGVAAWGAMGATLPDLPAVAGAIRLGARRRWVTRRECCEEVCEKGPFGGPDAALHSALLAFLLGWAGHALADALTHAEDARPILWPLSGWRFRSPISYWDNSRHARAFALAEHGALLLVAARTTLRKLRAPRSVYR